MIVENWLSENYEVRLIDQEKIIVWTLPNYKIFTPVIKFVEMFGNVIQGALHDGSDVKEAMRASDPSNTKGFNEIL